MKICEMNYHYVSTGTSYKQTLWEGEAYAWCRASHEDQTAQISRSLVAQGTRSVDQRSDTIGLDGAPDQRRAPSGGGTGSLLRLEEFLLRVGGLGAVVGVTEDRGEDGERGGVVENCAKGNC